MIKHYITLLKNELLNPYNYIIAAIIGALVNLSISNSITSYVYPYVIPFITQLISHSILLFKKRHKLILAQLPINHDDPVFIIDHSGKILYCGGITKELFEAHNINNIEDLLDTKSCLKILDFAEKKKHFFQLDNTYSETTQMWYEVKIKRSEHIKTNLLIWLNDITQRKILNSRIMAMLNFSDKALTNINSLKTRDDVMNQIPPFLLKSGYQSVFIARTNDNGDFEGSVFKEKNKKIVSSRKVTIPSNSLAPIARSRKVGKFISDDIKNYVNREVFETIYPFENYVKKFVGKPIDTFVNYHESDFSIIAFNKKHSYNKYDNILIQTLVNNSRLIISLLDLAISYQERFMQEVMGLCAAAEYSDDVSGKHILRVNEYSKFIALKLGYSDEFVNTIGTVAALHDIGKVAIPDLIKKQSKYTPAERDLMKMHTIIGAQIISKMIKYASKRDEKLEMAYNIALHHHQTWNGTGYVNLIDNDEVIEPLSMDFKDYQQYQPLKGEEIPIEALIVSLADIYDALRSERQYKKSLSHEKTMEIITHDKQLDLKGIDRFGPELWNVFQKNHLEFDRIYNSLL